MITATKLIHGHRCLQTGRHDSANVEPLVHDFLTRLRHVGDQMITNYIIFFIISLFWWPFNVNSGVSSGTAGH